MGHCSRLFLHRSFHDLRLDRRKFNSTLSFKDDILYGFAPNSVSKYEIPEGIKKTTYRLFNRIDTLEEIVIPSTFTEVSGKFVDYCKNLKTVYCKALTPPVATLESRYSIFFDMEAPNIYVPLNSVPAYKTADGWKDYADNIVGYNF